MIGKVARLAFLDPEMARWIGTLAHEGARSHRAAHGLDVPAEVTACITELRAFGKAGQVREVPAVEAGDPIEEWLDVRAAASLAGVSRPTVYNWCTSGRLFGRRIGGRLLVDAEELRRIIADMATVKAGKGQSSPRETRRAS